MNGASTKLMRIGVLVLACGLMSGCCTMMRESRPATTQASASSAPFINAHAIIIVRHGDIDPAQKAALGNAAPLLPRGQQRAQELEFALKDAGITRIVTSSSLRTQQTAAPLAEALHLKPEIAASHGKESTPPPSPTAMAAPNSNAATAEATTMMDYLASTSHPTDTILVVYHHTVIPPILQQFGYTESPIDEATEFDRVYVILPNAKTHTYEVLRLRYGGKWN